MTGLHFVDANLLVYMRDGRERVKQPRALEWIELLWAERAGRTSMQVLSEYYVTVTRKLVPVVPAAEAWDDVTELLAWNPREIDVEVMARAREIEQRYRLSWWDSLVVAAAQVQECSVLLTEDLQDGMNFGGLRVRNPFLHAVGQPEAEYKVHPVAAALHRPRGRPRRAATA